MILIDVSHTRRATKVGDYYAYIAHTLSIKLLSNDCRLGSVRVFVVIFSQYYIFFITPIGSKTIKSKTQDTYILKLSTQAYMSIKHNTNT